MTTETQQQYVGYWECEAPLTPAMQNEDMAILTAIQWPEGLTISRMTVWVNGREYEWHRVSARLF